MKLISARATAGVAAVLLGAAVAGCSSAGGSATTTGDVSSMPIVHGLEATNLVVSDFPAIDSAGLYVAETEGLFAKEGLTVSVVPDFTSSQDTVKAIESGKAQISSGDYVTYMGDLVGEQGQQDTNLEIISEGSVLQPNVLALMAGPKSKISNLAQLKGRAIPISGIHDIGSLLIDSVLTDNNVLPSSVHYVPNIPLPAVPDKVNAGVFEAGPVPEPFVSEGEQRLGDKVLADLDQGATTNFPIVGYAVTRQWAAKNPNTLKAFVTALEYGQQIADTDRVELEKAIVATKFLQVTKSVASVISLPNYPTGIDPSQLKRVMDDMIEFKFFSGAALAKAKAFNISSALYQANIATATGQSGLLGS